MLPFFRLFQGAGWGGTDGASPLACSESKLNQIINWKRLQKSTNCLLSKYPLAFFGSAAFSEKESSALRDLIKASQ